MVAKQTKSLAIPPFDEIRTFEHTITFASKLSEIAVAGSAFDVVLEPIADTPIASSSLELAAG